MVTVLTAPRLAGKETGKSAGTTDHAIGVEEGYLKQFTLVTCLLPRCRFHQSGSGVQARF